MTLGSRNSVARQIDDNGELMKEGSQIDCYVEETNNVYELKMRMSTAVVCDGLWLLHF